MTDEAGVKRGGRRGDGERRVKFEGVGIREQAPPPRSSSYDCTLTCHAICHSSSYSSIPDLQVSEGRLTSLFKQSQLLLLTLAKHTQFSLDSKPTGFFSFSLSFFPLPPLPRVRLQLSLTAGHLMTFLFLSFHLHVLLHLSKETRQDQKLRLSMELWPCMSSSCGCTMRPVKSEGRGWTRFLMYSQ